jgi:hypothetical protein
MKKSSSFYIPHFDIMEREVEAMAPKALDLSLIHFE